MKPFDKVTIIGVGLLGASLAKGLKLKGLAGSITGYGRNQGNLEKAKQLGIIDHFAKNLAEAGKDADLIVLASPVGVIVPLVQNLIEFVKPGCLITDVGSVKASLVENIEALIPESVDFVGAHPIAGGEKSGLEASTADLFQGANCIVTPTQNTRPEALTVISDLWQNLGMNVIRMDVDEHDLVFGAVSHLPHIVAFALMNTVGKTKTKNQTEVTSLSGAGLKDITRIASSDPVMWRDICLANQNPVLSLIDQFQESLDKIKGWIENGEAEQLEEAFRDSNKYRLKLI